MDDFPCCHAIATLWKKNLSPSAYVSSYYTKDSFVATYAASIYPSGLNLFSRSPFDDIHTSSVLPPDGRRPRGRPKKKRILSAGEYASKHGHCRSCGKSGHNKRTCSNEGPSSIQQAPKKKIHSIVLNNSFVMFFNKQFCMEFSFCSYSWLDMFCFGYIVWELFFGI